MGERTSASNTVKNKENVSSVTKDIISETKIKIRFMYVYTIESYMQNGRNKIWLEAGVADIDRHKK